MAQYIKYIGENHPTQKLKPLVWAGILSDADAFVEAQINNRIPTPLQKLSFKIKSEADAAQLAVDLKRAAEKESLAKRQKISHRMEVRMGLRDATGGGVIGVKPARADTNIARALQLLPRQPGGKYML